MATIECKLGATEQTVAGHAYNFQRDAYGRFTCRIDRADDIKCFLAVEHYREVPDVPEEHAPTDDFVEPGFGLGDDDTDLEDGDENEGDEDEGDGDAPDLSFQPPPGGTSEPLPAPAADDLTKIAGIGPKVMEKLAVVGITTYQQIADLQPEAIEKLNEQLKLFGAITTKDWIGQAKALLPKTETQG